MCYVLKNIIYKGVHTHHQKVKEHPCHKKLKNFDMLVEMYTKSLYKPIPDHLPVTAIPTMSPQFLCFQFSDPWSSASQLLIPGRFPLWKQVVLTRLN